MHSPSRLILALALAAGLLTGAGTYLGSDTRSLRDRAEMAAFSRDYASAERLMIRQTRARNHQARDWYDLGNFQAKLGKTDLALANWKVAARAQGEMIAASPNASTIDLYNLACFRAVAGDRQGALEALERTVKAGWDRAPFTRSDADLVSLHDEPRYRAAVTLAELNATRLDSQRPERSPRDRTFRGN